MRIKHGKDPTSERNLYSLSFGTQSGSQHDDESTSTLPSRTASSSLLSTVLALLWAPLPKRKAAQHLRASMACERALRFQVQPLLRRAQRQQRQ